MKLARWIGSTVAVLFCIEVSVMALRYLTPGFSGPEFSGRGFSTATSFDLTGNANGVPAASANTPGSRQHGEGGSPRQAALRAIERDRT